MASYAYRIALAGFGLLYKRRCGQKVILRYRDVSAHPIAARNHNWLE
jgi:hypothetical protein